MRVIYLDVDGVLNCSSTRARIADSVGIDGRLVGNLRRIVTETGAKIVLISTWKDGWYREKSKKPFQNMFARYLDEKLSAMSLFAFDKTPSKEEDCFLSRGEGILCYNDRNGVTDFVILDDYQYDYDGCDLTGRWVKTDFCRGGLTEAKSIEAIAVIKGE